MKFNYQTEKKKFEKRWSVLREEYRRTGLSEQGIEEIYRYDWEDFKRERIFAIHNQYLDSFTEDYGGFNGDDGQNPLLKKFIDDITVSDTYFSQGYGWIEDIDSQDIYKILKTLTDMQIEILTEYVFNKRTQKEIAETMNVSQQAIAKQIACVKKKLKKI